jgi:hypothetical protein
MKKLQKQTLGHTQGGMPLVAAFCLGLEIGVVASFFISAYYSRNLR